MVSKIRNSNVELLRLVLMAFVVLLHFNNDTMGGAFALVKELPVDNAVLRLLEAFCVCAVNCFMIVSGYFLYENDKVKFGKILDILLIVIFYRFVDYGCRMIFLAESFSVKRVIMCFFPANYFAIFYVVCYLFSPFVAKMFRESSMSSANFLMFFLLLVFVIVPTLLDVAVDLHKFPQGFLSPISTVGNGGGYTIVHFFVMLCLGMWLKKTGLNPRAWILLLTYCASSLLIMVLQRKISAYNYDFALVVVQAAALFLLFNKLKFQSRAVNFAAKSCFAIFCIHTGGFANTMWRKFLITSEHFSGGLLVSVLWMVISVGGMFAGCLALSIAMRGVFGRIKSKACGILPTVSITDNQDE